MRTISNQAYVRHLLVRDYGFTGREASQWMADHGSQVSQFAELTMIHEHHSRNSVPCRKVRQARVITPEERAAIAEREEERAARQADRDRRILAGIERRAAQEQRTQALITGHSRPMGREHGTGNVFCGMCADHHPEGDHTI